ncbi:acetylxylan esterase [soil metagenome]
MTFKHDLPFDPTYGYTLDTLQQVPAPVGPPDFADFWRDTYTQTLAVPSDIERRAIKSTDSRYDFFEIDFTSLAGRVGGWLAMPRDEQPKQAMVIGHGYGGRGEPGAIVLDEPTAYLWPCARGFNRSKTPGVPDTGAFHVLHGIESRETYIHRFNVAELWSAAGVLLELVPEAAGRLFYYGTSFGGGLGAMMLPWESRIKRAFREVPSFGNIPLRLTLQCAGSGEAVRLYHNRRGDVMPVMQYFDAATAARHIQQPTLVAAALFDPAVAPPGQFAVYNGIPAEKKLFVKTAGHFAWGGEAEENLRMAEAVRAWFAD